MKRNKNKNIVSNQKNQQLNYEKSGFLNIEKFKFTDYLKYLSFDVAFGAVAVAIAFSNILKIQIHDCIPLFVVLFFAVLAIYNFDHLRDSKVSIIDKENQIVSRTNIDNQNNKRRNFFNQNSKLLLFVIIFSFCVIAYQSLFYLDLYVISSGIVLSFSQIMYFLYLKKKQKCDFQRIVGQHRIYTWLCFTFVVLYNGKTKYT